MRMITDCKSLLDCLAEDASVPEDRGTALTVASLRERCSAGVGRDEKRPGSRGPLSSTKKVRKPCGGDKMHATQEKVTTGSSENMDLKQKDW